MLRKEVDILNNLRTTDTINDTAKMQIKVRSIGSKSVVVGLIETKTKGTMKKYAVLRANTNISIILSFKNLKNFINLTKSFFKEKPL